MSSMYMRVRAQAHWPSFDDGGNLVEAELEKVLAEDEMVVVEEWAERNWGSFRSKWDALLAATGRPWPLRIRRFYGGGGKPLYKLRKKERERAYRDALNFALKTILLKEDG